MYLSKNKNFAFIAVPRTGSHSFQQALEEGLMTNTSIDTSQDIFFNTNAGKPNNQIGLFPTDPSQLQEFLELENTSFPRRGAFPPDLRYTIMMYHLTPTHLVKGGLVSEQELGTLNIFGAVRDPIERWMSHTFLSSKITMDLEEGKEIEYVIDFIRVKLKNHRYPPMIKPFMQDYFYYEGQRVGTPYLNTDMLSVYNNLMDTIPGASHISALPHIKPLGATIPEKCKAPIDTWLPKDCVDDLLDRLALDIEFYNRVVNNEFSIL